MSLLSASDISAIREDVRDIVKDDSVGTTIIFQLSGSTANTWSPTSQLIPSMFASSSVSAFKGSYSLYEIEQSGGIIEYGDVRFTLMADDVSGVLATIDRVIESGSTWQSATTYELRNIDRDPLKICYFLQVRAI